jgi:predicted DNA-binding ribbon-helix-helix protein
MRSPVLKRSVSIRGHKTSVTLEDQFWQGLREIAEARNITMASLVDEIDASRETTNLSSNIRLFVLGYYCGRGQVAGGAPNQSAQLTSEPLNC